MKKGQKMTEQFPLESSELHANLNKSNETGEEGEGKTKVSKQFPLETPFLLKDTGVANTQKNKTNKKVFLTQNIPLSRNCSNPMRLLHAKKVQICMTECVLVKGSGQSLCLSLSLFLSDAVGVWSGLLEHINLDCCQARVGDTERGQW